MEILVNPDAADTEHEIGEVTAAAQTLGQRIQVLSASGDAAIETAFATLAERGVRGLFISPNAFFTNRREQIIALAARYVVPALYGWREYVVSGGLVSYGTSLVDAYWQVGAYARASSVVPPEVCLLRYCGDCARWCRTAACGHAAVPPWLAGIKCNSTN